MIKTNDLKSLLNNKAIKTSIVLLLLFITFINTFLKFNGNWPVEIVFLVAQLYYSIYGGFYAYLFEKPMSGRFSSVDFIPNDHENKTIRNWWLLVHTGIFILIQLR